MTLDPALAQETTATLQELAALCRQVEDSFRHCADQARADDVRALLRRRAEDYKSAGDALRAHAQRLGVPPEADAAEPGRQPCTVVRSILNIHGDPVLVEECERCEDKTLERYAQALARPLEPAAKEALQTQRLEMRRQHELLRTLRDRLSGVGS